MQEKSVIVIGAGIAGLTAAVQLARTGWAVTVLEARDRIGGRICSMANDAGSAPIELGAEFIHGENVASWPYLRAAGLKTHELPGHHWYVTERGLEKDDPADELEGWQRQIELSAQDQSVDDFFRHNSRLTERSKLKLREYVAGFHAADPQRISVQAVAKSERATEEKEGRRLFRVTEGYDTLVNCLRGQLEAAGRCVQSGQVVKRIRWHPGRVEAETLDRQSARTFEGRHAIITLPLGVLKTGGPGSVLFEPELADKAEALAGLEMGHVTKVVLRFRSRLWPVDEFGFIHSQDEWLPTWWTDQGGVTLTGWAGGPRAARLSAHDEEFIGNQARRALAALLGLTESKISAELQSLHVHDWSHDPFSCGAYSYIGVGALDAPEQLAQPVEETLFFAGEATAADGQQGTVHGAIASAERAARMLQSIADT